MEGIIALTLNDLLHIECVAHYVKDVFFGENAGNKKGYIGLLYYLDETPLLKKIPSTDLQNIFNEIVKSNSNLTILFVTDRTIANFKPELISPYRFKNWSFQAALNVVGALKEIDGLDLKSLPIPKYLRSNIRAYTPSELFFHLILSFLHTKGVINKSNPEPFEIYDGINKAASLLPSYISIDRENFSYHGVLSNGEELYMFNFNTPIWFLDVKGIFGCRFCEKKAQSLGIENIKKDHPLLNFKFFTSIEPQNMEQFHKIPFNSVIVLKENTNYEIYPIKDLHKKN